MFRRSCLGGNSSLEDGGGRDGETDWWAYQHIWSSGAAGSLCAGQCPQMSHWKQVRPCFCFNANMTTPITYLNSVQLKLNNLTLDVCCTSSMRTYCNCISRKL